MTRSLRSSRRFALPFLLLAASLGAASAPPGPRPVRFQATWRARIAVEDFLTEWRADLGLRDPSLGDELRLLADRPARLPGLRVRLYRQEYRGVPVEEGLLSIVTRLEDDTVVSATGGVVPGLELPVEPEIEPGRAVQAALEALAHELGLDPRQVELSRDTATSLRVRGTGERPALVFRVELATEAPRRARRTYDVDASQGVVLAELPWRLGAWTPSTGLAHSLFDGPVVFPDQRDTATGVHRLRSTKVETYDNQTAADEHDISHAKDFLSTSEAFEGGDLPTAASWHWALGAAHDELEALNLSCIGHATLEIPVVRGYWGTPGAGGGYFDPNTGLFHTLDDRVTPDLAGHELAHCARVQALGSLEAARAVNTGEARALDESLADALGEHVERGLRGSSDWTLAGDLDAWRSLANPAASTAPGADTYGTGMWVPLAPGQVDGIYEDAGVQDRWFYLLSMGGGPAANGWGDLYQVEPVGPDLALQVLLGAEIDKPVPDYETARFETRAAARALCGERSQLARQAWNAWYAVGVGRVEGPTPQPALGVEPQDGATLVEPWPARLHWPAAGVDLEIAWSVQVSTSPDFAPAATRELAVAGSSVGPGGAPEGTLELGLDPDTLYYWRVRRAENGHEQDLPACFRPAASFRTAPKVAGDLWPATPPGSEQRFHPWQLEFTWKSAPGAKSYQVEVAADPSFEPATQLFPTVTTGSTSVVLDVKVERTLFWRVRPSFDDAQGLAHHGSWSQVRFLTTLPRAEALAPVGGADVFPWPVRFEWASVKGADHFVFEVDRLRGGSGDPAGDHFSTALPGSQLETTLDVRADDWIIDYRWRLRVVGPRIGSGGVQEEGAPAEAAFIVSDEQTEVQELAPDLQACVDENEATLRWARLPGATAYEIWREPVLCPTPQGSCTHGQAVTWGHLVGATEAPEQEYTLGFEPVGFFPDEIAGRWEVVAIGPGGLRGHLGYMTGGSYTYNGSIPSLRFTNDDHADGAYDQHDVVEIEAGLHVAPYGLVHLLLTDLASGSSRTITTSFGSTAGARHFSLDLDSEHVVPGDYGVAVETDPARRGLVTCEPGVIQTTLHVTSTDQPPDVPTVWDGGHGYLGYILAIFSAESGATSYQAEVRQGSAQGPLVGEFDWPLAVLVQARQEIRDLGYTIPDSAWIGRILGTDPGQDYFYRVRACNPVGCSDWSTWGQWGEQLFPWPW